VLLNIAQTTLHNHCILAARAAGLSPALGILHECRAGHAAFASDLQEPFRHFMDRCVLEACHVLKPADFALGDPLESPYRLIIRPAAARDFRALVASQLAHQYRRRDHAESRSIHDWIGILARNLRQVLLAPGQPLIPFEHPA
jgi:CRISPR/Cas system-associated endonuclease Cas1